MNWLVLHIVKQHYKHQIINRIEQKKKVSSHTWGINQHQIHSSTKLRVNQILHHYTNNKKSLLEVKQYGVTRHRSHPPLRKFSVTWVNTHPSPPSYQEAKHFSITCQSAHYTSLFTALTLFDPAHSTQPQLWLLREQTHT